MSLKHKIIGAAASVTLAAALTVGLATPAQATSVYTYNSRLSDRNALVNTENYGRGKTYILGPGEHVTRALGIRSYFFPRGCITTLYQINIFTGHESAFRVDYAESAYWYSDRLPRAKVKVYINC